MKRNIERVILVAFVWAVMLGGYWLAGYEFKRCFSFGILYFYAVISSGLSLILHKIIKMEKEGGK